ncbi:urease accessory protein UreD [Leifsonia kafniensis]|uniref:Urease accessory protein UreD n=1 Tax=Leifsonia kafniensis TaxID=475957 RepID=A0ABP7K287_9MICO
MTIETATTPMDEVTDAPRESGAGSTDGLPTPYGGYRVTASHYEPTRVPQEVLRFAGDPESLRVGSPGKVGVLQLTFARNSRGTELTKHYQKSPLQIMRPLYYDPLRPDMPSTMLMTTGGGMVSGDRHRTDLVFGQDTSAHVTTQAFAKVYRMEFGYAAATTNLTLEAGAFVEFLPDPVIPFANSRYYQRTAVVLDSTATLIASETVYAGRLARDERHLFDVYASDFEVRRPDGTLVALDRVRLCPTDSDVNGVAVLGGFDVLAMLYVLTPLISASELADQLHSALAEAYGAELLFGVSVLPGESGVWLRLLSNDTVLVARASALAAGFVHELLTGIPAPASRKS